MLKTIHAFAVLSFFLIGIQIAQAQTPIFNAFEGKLDNGMRVVVIPNPRAPVVTHMVWYAAGSADEPRGKSGIAHFLEHLMFKGSGDLEPGEFSKIVRALGGRDNAFTSYDYTAYFQSVPVQHLETVMRMEADRMRGLTPPPEEVLSERNVVLEERRQRTENDPRSLFGEQMRSVSYINHPYSMPIIGWRHEIEGLDWKDAQDFHTRWYRPDNAILVVSGDVTGEDVMALAKQTYGTIEKAETPARLRTQSPPLPGQKELRMSHPDIKQASLHIRLRAPSYRQDRETAYALDIIDEILSGGPTSRLYKSLVIDQKIATSVSLSYQGTAWDDGAISISATPVPGHDLESLRSAIENELARFVKDGPTAQEMADAKKRLKAAAIYARDSLSGPAMIFGYSLITGSSVEDIEYWPDHIDAVTRDQVVAAAQHFLDSNAEGTHPWVYGYLTPEAVSEEVTP